MHSQQALAYFYMVAAWGGYVFIINIIPIYVVVMVIAGRYSSRLYIAYSTFYALGSIMAMQVRVGGEAVSMLCRGSIHCSCVYFMFWCSIGKKESTLYCEGNSLRAASQQACQEACVEIDAEWTCNSLDETETSTEILQSRVSMRLFVCRLPVVTHE